jgi:hypothetical protein
MVAAMTLINARYFTEAINLNKVRLWNLLENSDKPLIAQKKKIQIFFRKTACLILLKFNHLLEAADAKQHFSCLRNQNMTSFEKWFPDFGLMTSYNFSQSRG